MITKLYMCSIALSIVTMTCSIVTVSLYNVKHSIGA